MPWDTSLTIVRAVVPGWRLPAFSRQESPQGPHPCQPSMAGRELEPIMGLLQGPVCAAWSRQPALHKEPGSTQAHLFHCSNQHSASSNVVIHSLTFWRSSIINKKRYVHKNALIINSLFSNAGTNYNVLVGLRKLFSGIWYSVDSFSLVSNEPWPFCLNQLRISLEVDHYSFLRGK